MVSATVVQPVDDWLGSADTTKISHIFLFCGNGMIINNQDLLTILYTWCHAKNFTYILIFIFFGENF